MQGLPAGAQVGVIGGGAMGAGIAQVAAFAGHPVVVLEVDPERAAAAAASVVTAAERRVDRGRMSPAAAGPVRDGVRGSTEVADLADCALVVEAVVEQLEVKRVLLSSVEDVVGASCVLATNTSSLSIDAIAAGLRDPSRLVGMHFFNPAPAMRLVEVVTGLRTAAAAADLVQATAEGWGKATVRCASTPGFVVNRVARPFYSEALAVTEEFGLDPAVVDALYREAGGFRMGPLEVTDLIGQDVNAAVTESVWRALDLDPRNRPSRLQRSLVDAGWLGRKTGRGFYDHAADADGQRPAPRPAELPEPVGGVVRVGPDSPLRPLLTRTAARLDDAPALEAWAQLPSGALLGRTDGELAVEAAARLGRDVVLLDLALDLATTSRVGATASSDDLLPELAALLAGAQVALTPLPDTPGLLLARTVALLVDEAVDLASRQRMPASVLDDAVQLGLNYPVGPLEWGDRVGPAELVRLLDTLEQHLPGGRFRVSTPLRTAAVRGAALRG